MLLDLFLPSLRRRLPGTRDATVEVWVQSGSLVSEKSDAGDVVAVTYRQNDLIVMREASWGARAATLAHELVHHVLDDSWDPLPHAVEEGLADLMRIESVPSSATSTRAERVLGLYMASASFDVTLQCSRPMFEPVSVSWTAPASGESTRPEDVLSLEFAEFGRRAASRDQMLAMRGVGYLVASRIVDRAGVGALHDLCVRAESEGLDLVPTPWLLDAAELPEDLTGWRDAVDELTGRDELEALSGSWSGPLARLAAAELSRPGALGVEDMTAEGVLGAVVLELHAGLPGTSVALNGGRQFREAFAASWNGLP